MTKSQLLIDEVARTLKSKGFKVGFVEYPIEEHRSVDIVARRQNKKILIRASFEVDSIGYRELKELAALSDIFDSIGLVIGRKTKKKELEDYIVYERYSVPTLTPESLKELIDKGGLYVYADRGGYYVRINSEKFKERREERNLSLGDVAYMLGVSRKAVYEYERKTMNLSLITALKLVKIFGEDILLPVDFNELRKKKMKLETPYPKTKLKVIVNELHRLGYKTVITERTPIDIAGKKHNKGKIAIAVKETVKSENEVEAKLESAEIISKTLNINALIVDSTEKIVSYIKDFYQS